MLRATLESLETRRLLSVSLAESEPNDGPADAIALPRRLDDTVHVTGAIGAAGDLDWFKIKLKPGDVFGASLRADEPLDAQLTLGDAAGKLLLFNDDSYFEGSRFPDESPMPAIVDSDFDPEVYYVITEPGTYYLQASAFVDPETGETSTGAYDLDIVVARPGMQSKPAGSKQILFLDFDGGTVPFDDGGGGVYAPAPAPLVDSLAEWGLRKRDLNAVIDETLKRVNDKLYKFVAANGDNGDYRRSGKPGDFGIDIRNSRDHRDPFGKNALASRIIVGHTDDALLAEELIGLAQHLDIGNYKPNDEAVVSTNFIAGLLEAFPPAKPNSRAMIIDYVAEYMSVLISHEMGHLVGAIHTAFTFENSFNEPVTLMDKDIRVPLGPDLVFGTSDDITMQFGVDDYDPGFLWFGINDTLNTVAYGLSTGTVRGGGHDDDDRGREGGRGAFAAHDRRSGSAWRLLESMSDEGVGSRLA